MEPSVAESQAANAEGAQWGDGQVKRSRAGGAAEADQD